MTVTTSKPSICCFCFNACAMIVDFEDGEPVAVRGDKSNPIYQGYFCVKGQQLLEVRNHPERLLQSQKRGADGVYRPIPISQALDEISEKLSAIRDAHGPRAIAMYGGIPQGNPGRFLSDALKRGMKLIAIDPRKTETAERASLFLQPKPGEDVAIVAALLHLIFKEKRYDRFSGLPRMSNIPVRIERRAAPLL